MPTTVVVSLGLHVSEASATQSVEFQANGSALLVSHHVDVGLLANANLVAEGTDRSPQGEGFQSQVIVARVGQAVTIICGKKRSTTCSFSI